MTNSIYVSLRFFLLSFISFGQNYVDLSRLHYSTTPQNEFASIGGTTNIEEFGAELTLHVKLHQEKGL